MRVVILFFLFCFILCADDANSKKDFSKTENGAFQDVVNALETEFSKIDSVVEAHGEFFSSEDLEETFLREQLNSMAESYSFVMAAGLINNRGILTFAEPGAAKESEGLDLGKEEKIQRILRGGPGEMSALFNGSAGAPAFELLYPVDDDDGERTWILTLLTDHVDFISCCALPAIKDLSVNIWVIQTDGVMLYDENREEIGLNILTDSLYSDFDELVELTRKITENKTGKGEYSFFDHDLDRVIKKKAKWTTVTYLNREWRVVMNTENK